MEREGDRPIQVVRARYTRAAPIPAAPGGEWRVEGRGKGEGQGGGGSKRGEYNTYIDPIAMITCI